MQPWVGIRDATKFGDAPVQHISGAVIRFGQLQPRSEDCLTLNVTAPLRPSAQPCPVMVFIHGGGYISGTSAAELYSGVSLVRRGEVVVVSINYRLGALGYADFTKFSTHERPFDSNLGLRDQVAALQWVQRNISAFGGDPTNVTIFGQSAGANAVITLLAVPAAKGLFHRAIAESAPADWAVTEETASEFASRCIEELGASPEDANAMLCDADASAIFRAGMRVAKQGLRHSPGYFPMVPVVDGNYLPKPPIAACDDGSAHPVPLIIGTNRHEATLFAKLMDDLPTDRRRIDKVLSAADPCVKADLLATYPGYPARRAAVKFGGDYAFWYPSIRLCTAHSPHAPTYSYRYDFAPRILHGFGLGAAHGTELLAVFAFGEQLGGQILTGWGGRRGLRNVTKEVQRHWLNFARTGEPLPSWPAYSAAKRNTLIIDAAPRLTVDPGRERRLGWERLHA